MHEVKNPFQEQMNRLQAAEIYGVDDPLRCEVCEELLELRPGVLQRFCSKKCRRNRKKGRNARAT